MITLGIDVPMLPQPIMASWGGTALVLALCLVDWISKQCFISALDRGK